jgi:hypothetical protein
LFVRRSRVVVVVAGASRSVDIGATLGVSGRQASPKGDRW